MTQPGPGLEHGRPPSSSRSCGPVLRGRSRRTARATCGFWEQAGAWGLEPVFFLREVSVLIQEGTLLSPYLCLKSCFSPVRCFPRVFVFIPVQWLWLGSECRGQLAPACPRSWRNPGASPCTCLTTLGEELLPVRRRTGWLWQHCMVFFPAEMG